MGKSSRNHSYARCRSCHHSVFIGTRRCPHCGHLMHWNLKPLAVWLAAIIIGVVLSFTLVRWLEVGQGSSAEPELASSYNS